jgi:hypothetical protein
LCKFSGVNLPIALCMLFAGCASPPTGRTRDAQLLYDADQSRRNIVSVEKAGPFYEQVVTAGGGKRTSYRPLFYTKIESEDENAVQKEILWPVYSSTQRDDSLTWRFLLWFGYDKDITQTGDYSRTWLFPLWFSGTTKEGERYAALFPLYGTVRDIYVDRFHFVLFPIWMESARGTHSSWSVLWPIISKTSGEKMNGFRVFPFYGEMDYQNTDKTRFVLWPFWTSGKYTGRNPGDSWMLFPVVGRVNRASESSWLIIPPFFNVSHGRGKLDYYRKINCPWPFVQIHDGKNSHKRYFWPIYTHRYDDAGDFSNRTILWPFFNFRTANRAAFSEKSRSLFFFYADSDVKRDLDGDGVYETHIEAYNRFWPLYSYQTDPDNKYYRFPDLNFSKRTGPADRNFLGMFTLYTLGSSEENKRVDHELLWGFFRRGYGENYSRLSLWPFYNYDSDAGDRKWSILGGLLGREGDSENSRWRWLWFFGGKNREGGT